MSEKIGLALGAGSARGLDLHAYMSVNTVLEVGGLDGNVVLMPRMQFTMRGLTHPRTGEVPEYMIGSVQGPGVPFSRSDFEDVNGLDRAGQREKLSELMRDLLTQLVQHQKETGMHEVWSVAL